MSWQKRNLASVIENIPMGVAVTLPDGRIEYANPHLRRMLDLRTQQPGRFALAAFREPADGGLQQQIREALFAGRCWQAETRFRTAAGDAREVLESVYPMADETGAVTHFIHFVQDIGAAKQIETLRVLAFHDSLTGLPNRNLFNDRLARAIASAQRNGGGFALLYIDIDRFKRVNDTLGHDAGDALLRQVALRLQGGLRKSDTVARLGGDEFAAILGEVADRACAAALVDKLRDACGGRYRLGGREWQVTLSVGFSLYPDDARDADALLKRADEAMYRAKAAATGGRSLQEPPAAQRYRAA
jgi:diguanylate cyclase (GGDEF)-like protein/PAS domain S-box-containing protein